MKMDYDLARDILFSIEQLSTGSDLLLIDKIAANMADKFPVYKSPEFIKMITYHTRQLAQAGYIRTPSKQIDGTYIVVDLTPAGHSLLANIRNDEIWELAKKETEPLGGAALPMLADIASMIYRSKIEITYNIGTAINSNIGSQEKATVTNHDTNSN